VPRATILSSLSTAAPEERARHLDLAPEVLSA